jgi:hypothetical protein
MQENENSQLEKALRLQAGRVGFEAVVPNPKLKLLDQVREVLRLRHYSIRTEQSYCDWIRRYILLFVVRQRLAATGRAALEGERPGFRDEATHGQGREGSEG